MRANQPGAGAGRRPARASLLRLSLPSLLLALGLVSMAPPVAAEAAPAPAAEAARLPLPFPKLGLLKPLRGEAAIAALGGRLPEIAAWYGMSAERLGEILRRDRTSWIDRQGRLYYVDDKASAPVAAEAPVFQQAPFPLDETFQLHSRPGAQRVIYLDFDGHVASGTAWNTDAEIDPINAAAYDTDGHPASFDSAERSMIQLVWQRVANDYAPFAVDVTTEEPPAASITRSSGADQVYGTRAVITDDNFSDCDCGGIAYLGVFDESFAHSQTQPAWIFNQGSAKVMAETISHEVGHNFGLSHDGSAAVEYYEGHGNGPTGWGPIMGAVFDRELSQWSKGDYPGANNPEDDLNIINSHGGVYRSDDFTHGYTGAASYASLAPLTGDNDGSSFTVDQSGMIARNSDSDDFAFQTDGGNASFTVVPQTSPGTNLDASLALFDSAGSLIASASDPVNVSAQLNTTLAAGAYFLRVDNTGDDSPAPGYPSYGSLGEYRVTGSFITGDAPEPFSFSSQTNVPLSSKRTSDIATISGLAAAVPVSVSGGTYSIGCASNGFTANSGSIGNGQTVCVRHTSSSTPGASVTTTLTIGGMSGSFSSTTQADTTPNSFSFTAQNNVAPSTKRTSSTVTIGGINAATAISVSGGTYSIGCSEAGFTAQAKTINNGQGVCLRHTSSAAPGASVTTTLTIGGINGSFSSTTGSDTTPNSFGFTAQTNVPVSTKRTSNAATVSGLTAPAPISVTGGTYSIGCSETGFTAQTRTISNGQNVCLRHISSANPAATLTTTLGIGGVTGTFSSTTAP